MAGGATKEGFLEEMPWVLEHLSAEEQDRENSGARPAQITHDMHMNLSFHPKSHIIKNSSSLTIMQIIWVPIDCICM